MNEFQFLAPDGFYRTVPGQSFSSAYMSGGIPIEVSPEVEVLSPSGLIEKLYHRDASDKIRTQNYRLINDPKPLRLSGPDNRIYKVNPQDISLALGSGGSVILKELSTSKPLNPQVAKAVITDEESTAHNWVGPVPQNPERLKNWDTYTNILNKNRASRAGFFESIIPSWENIPWAGTVVGLAESGKIASTAEKLRKGENVSEQDVLDLNIYLANMQREGDATWGGQVGAVIRDSLTFSTELLLGTVASLFTAGSASPAFAAALAKKATAVGARQATKKAAQELLDNGLVKNAQGVVTGFAPGGQKLFTDFVTQRGVTSQVWRPFAQDFGRTMFGRKTANDLFEAGAKLTTAERTGGFLADVASFAVPPTLITSGLQAIAGSALGDGPTTVRGNQQKLFDSLMNQDPSTSSPFWYGVADSMIENVSESLGRYLMLPFGKLGKVAGLEGAGKKIGEQIDNWTARTLNEAGDEAQKQLAAKTKGLTAFAAHATRKARDLQLSYEGVMKVFRDAGYDGVLEEMLEERAGGFMRGLFGLEGDEADNNIIAAFKGIWPGLEQLTVEAAAFSAPMLFSFGLPIALSPRGFARQYKDRQQLNEALRIAQSHMQGVSEEDIQKWEASNRPGVLGIETTLPILDNIQKDYRTYQEAGAQGGKMLRALNSILDRVASAQYVEGRGMVLDPEVGFLATMSLPVGHYMEVARSQYQDLKKGQKIDEKELDKVGAAAGLRAVVTLGKVATAYETLDNVVPQDQMLSLLSKEELELAIDLGVVRRDVEDKMLYLQPIETWNESDLEAAMDRMNERAAKKEKKPDTTVEGVAKVIDEKVETQDPAAARKQVYDSLVGKLRETGLDPAKALALESQGIRYFGPQDLGNREVQKLERSIFMNLPLRRRMEGEADPMSPQELAYKAIMAPASMTPQEMDAFTTVFGVASLFRGESLRTTLEADFGKHAAILRAAESGRIVLPGDTIVDKNQREYKAVSFEKKDGVAGWRVEGKPGLIPETEIGVNKDYTVRPAENTMEARGVLALSVGETVQGNLRQVIDELDRMSYVEVPIPTGVSFAEWKRTSDEAERKAMWDRMPEEQSKALLDQRYRVANIPRGVTSFKRGDDVVYRFSTGALSFSDGRIAFSPARQVLAEGRYVVEDFIEGYLKAVGTAPSETQPGKMAWNSKQFWSSFPGLEKAYNELRKDKEAAKVLPTPGNMAADVEIVSHIITDLALGFENANIATLLPWYNQLEAMRNGGLTAESPAIRDAAISMQRIMGQDLFEELRYEPRAAVAARVEGRPAPTPAPQRKEEVPSVAEEAAEEEVSEEVSEEEEVSEGVSEEAAAKAAEEAAKKKAKEEADKKKAADKAAKKKAKEEAAKQKAAEEEAKQKAAEEEAKQKAAEQEAAEGEKEEEEEAAPSVSAADIRKIISQKRSILDGLDEDTAAVAVAKPAKPARPKKQIAADGPDEPLPATNEQDAPEQVEVELPVIDSQTLFSKHPGLVRIAFTMGKFEKELKRNGLMETGTPLTTPYQFVSDRLGVSFEEAKSALKGITQIPAAVQMLQSSPLTQELSISEGFALTESIVDEESQSDNVLSGPTFRKGEDFGAKYLSEAVKAVTAFTTQVYGYDITLQIAQRIREIELPSGEIMGVDKLPAHYKNEKVFDKWAASYDEAREQKELEKAKRLMGADKIPESGVILLGFLTRLLPYDYSLNLINALQNSIGREVLSAKSTTDKDGNLVSYELSSRNTSTTPLVQQRVRSLLQRLTPDEYFGERNAKLRQSLDAVREAIDGINNPKLEKSLGFALSSVAGNPNAKPEYVDLLNKFTTAFSQFLVGTNSTAFKQELLALLSSGTTEETRGAEIRLQIFKAWNEVLSPLQKLHTRRESGKITPETANVGLQRLVDTIVMPALGLSENISEQDLGSTEELAREAFTADEFLREAIFRTLPKKILQITGRGSATNRQASGLVAFTTRNYASERVARRLGGSTFLLFDVKRPQKPGEKVGKLSPVQARELLKEIARSEFDRVQTGQVGRLLIYDFLTGDKGEYTGIILPLTAETEIAPGKKMSWYLSRGFDVFYRDVYGFGAEQPGLAERINTEVLNLMLGENVNKMKKGDAVKRASQLGTPSIRPVVNVDGYIQTDENGNVEYVVALIPDGKGGFRLPNGPGDGLVAMIPGKEGAVKKSSKVTKETQAMVKLGYIGRTDKNEMVQVKGAVVAFDGKDGMPALSEGEGITPASLQAAMNTKVFKTNTKNAYYFVSGSSLKLKPEFVEQFSSGGITFGKFRAPPLGLVSPMPDNSIIRAGFLGPQVFAGLASVATMLSGDLATKRLLVTEFLKEVFGEVRSKLSQSSRINRRQIARQLAERYPAIALLELNGIDAPWFKATVDRLRENKLIRASEGEIQKTINAIRSASNDAVEAVNTAPEGTRDTEYGFRIVEGRGELPLLSPYEKLADGRLSAPRMAMSVMLTPEGEQISSEDLVRLETKMGRPLATFEENYIDTLMEKLTSTFGIRTKPKQAATRKVMQDLLRPVRDDSMMIPLNGSTPFGKTPEDVMRFVAWLQANEGLLLDLTDVDVNTGALRVEKPGKPTGEYQAKGVLSQEFVFRREAGKFIGFHISGRLMFTHRSPALGSIQSAQFARLSKNLAQAATYVHQDLLKKIGADEDGDVAHQLFISQRAMLLGHKLYEQLADNIFELQAASNPDRFMEAYPKKWTDSLSVAAFPEGVRITSPEFDFASRTNHASGQEGVGFLASLETALNMTIDVLNTGGFSYSTPDVVVNLPGKARQKIPGLTYRKGTDPANYTEVRALVSRDMINRVLDAAKVPEFMQGVGLHPSFDTFFAGAIVAAKIPEFKQTRDDFETQEAYDQALYNWVHQHTVQPMTAFLRHNPFGKQLFDKVINQEMKVSDALEELVDELTKKSKSLKETEAIEDLKNMVDAFNSLGTDLFTIARAVRIIKYRPTSLSETLDIIQALQKVRDGETDTKYGESKWNSAFAERRFVETVDSRGEVKTVPVFTSRLPRAEDLPMDHPLKTFFQLIGTPFLNSVTPIVDSQLQEVISHPSVKLLTNNLTKAWEKKLEAGDEEDTDAFKKMHREFFNFNTIPEADFEREVLPTAKGYAKMLDFIREMTTRQSLAQMRFDMTLAKLGLNKAVEESAMLPDELVLKYRQRRRELQRKKEFANNTVLNTLNVVESKGLVPVISEDGKKVKPKTLEFYKILMSPGTNMQLAREDWLKLPKDLQIDLFDMIHRFAGPHRLELEAFEMVPAAFSRELGEMYRLVNDYLRNSPDALKTKIPTYFIETEKGTKKPQRLVDLWESHLDEYLLPEGAHGYGMATMLRSSEAADVIPAAMYDKPARRVVPTAPTQEPTPTGETFEIVSDKGKYDVLGMRVGRSHMNNTEPGKPGWLGNPYKWSGNGGPKNVTKEQATEAFRKDFMAKLESDPAFRQAVLNLRGKKVGYYRPKETDTHIRVVQEVLRSLPATQEPESKTPEFDKLPAYRPGQKTMIYAGIGSRETPQEVQNRMSKVATELAKRGYTLQSGGAEGADKAFEKGAPAGKRKIFTAGGANERTIAIAKEIHPRPSALKEYPLKLMARNTYQIFGAKLDSPVDFVLAWTPDGAESTAERTIKTGGTGQAIDMASRKGIPVINMAREGWEAKLRSVLGLKQQQSAPATPKRQFKAGEPITVVHEGKQYDTVFRGLSFDDGETFAVEEIPGVFITNFPLSQIFPRGQVPTAAIASTPAQALAWSANRKARADLDIPEDKPVVGKGASKAKEPEARRIMRSFNQRWKFLAEDMQNILAEDGVPVQIKADRVRQYISDRKAQERWPKGPGGAALDRNIENLLQANYAGTETLEDLTTVGEQAMLEEMRGAVEAEVARGEELEVLEDIGYEPTAAVASLLTDQEVLDWQAYRAGEYEFPEESSVEVAKKQGVLYRGLNRASVEKVIRRNSDGSLTLFPQKNMYGQTEGVSASPYRFVAWDYATRDYARGTSRHIYNSGLVLTIVNPDLSAAESESAEEVSFPSEVTIPAGQWQIDRVSKFSEENFNRIIAEFEANIRRDLPNDTIGLLESLLQLQTESEFEEMAYASEQQIPAADTEANAAIISKYGTTRPYRRATRVAINEKLGKLISDRAKEERTTFSEAYSREKTEAAKTILEGSGVYEGWNPLASELLPKESALLNAYESSALDGTADIPTTAAVARQTWSPEARLEQQKLGIDAVLEDLAPRSGYHPSEGVNLADAASPANQPYDPETKQGRFVYPSRWRKVPPVGMVNSFEKTLLDLGITPQVELSLQDGNTSALYPSVGIFQGDRETLPLAVTDYLVKHVMDESVGRRMSALGREVPAGRYPLFDLGQKFEGGPHSALVAEELKRQLYGSRTLFTSPNNPVSRLVRTLKYEIDNGNLGTLLQRGIVTMDKQGELNLGFQNEPRELVPADRIDSPPPVPLAQALPALVKDKGDLEILEAALNGREMVSELRGLYDAGRLDYDAYQILLESAAYQSGLSDPYAQSLGGPDVTMAIAAAIPPPNTRAALLKTAGVPGAHFLLWESMNELHIMEKDTGEYYNWTNQILALNTLEVTVWDKTIKNRNRADGSPRPDGRWDKSAEKITLTLEEARERDEFALLIRNLVQYRSQWEDGTWRSQKAVRPSFTPKYAGNELRRDEEKKILFEEDVVTLGELYDNFMRSSYRKKMLEKAGRTEEHMNPMEWAKQYAEKFDADNRILNQKFSWAFDGQEFMPYMRDYFPRNAGSLRYADPLNQLIDSKLYDLERSTEETGSRLATDVDLESALKVERGAQAKAPTEPMTRLLDELLTAQEKERLISVETGQYTITASQAADRIRRKLAARVRSGLETQLRQSTEAPDVALQSWMPSAEAKRDLATIAQISRLNRGPRFTEWASAEFSRTLGRTDYEAYVNSRSSDPDNIASWYRPETYNFADVRRQYVVDTYNAALNKAMLSGFVTITDPEGRPLMMAKPVPNLDLDKSPIRREAWIKAAQIQSDAAKLETPFDPTAENLVNELIRVYNDSRNRITSDNKVIKSPKAASVEEWTVFDNQSKMILEQVIQVPFTETSKTFRALMSAVQWTKRLSVGFSAFFYVALAESSISASGIRRNLAVKLMSDPKFRSQFANGVQEFKAMREYYDPYISSRSRALIESGLRSSGPGVAVDQPNTIVDTQMAQIVGWMKEKKGEKEANWLNYVMTGDTSALNTWPGMRAWPGLSGKKWSDAMFGWFSAIKEYQTEMIMMNQAIDSGLNVDSALNAPTWYSRRAAQYMNETLGGINWPQMVWTTPSVMAALNLILFATNWTTAAIQSSGLGYLLQRIKINGVPLGTNYAPGQLPMIGASLVAMYFVVMQAIPLALQAAAYAAGQALGGDPDDTPLPWNNDPTRTDRIDVTPLMRHSPFYKGDPTGERRIYIQFAKQVHETGVLNPFGTRGWINEPYGQFMRKLSMPARYVVEMLTGQSPGSDWDLEFKGKGMLGWVNSGAPGFEGLWTSRIGYALQKVVPISFSQLLANLEVAPLNFFAPTSLGLSKTKITESMVQTLQTYASREDWRRIRQVPRARAKLETFMPELMLAAERNGYDPQQLLDSARGRVLSELYKKMWEAIDRDDVAGMNEAAASIMRVGGQTRGLLASLTARERTFGKPVTEEAKQKAVDALEQAYNGQF